MHPIEPTKQQVKALLKLPRDHAIVMLNLLKFKTSDAANQNGRSAYERYMINVKPLIQKAGGKLIFAGEAKLNLIGLATDIIWDKVIMVQYPAARDFMRMSSSAQYAAIHHDRAAGLELTKLIVIHQDT